MPSKPHPPYSRNTKIFIALFIAFLLAVNLCVFIYAYPVTFRLDGGGNLAKDFSAYYRGAYSLWHNPGDIYTRGILNDGETIINPHPQDYKYFPNFLILVSPFQFFSYHNGLIAFDIFQFVLLPFMALMLYRLLYKKGLAAILVVAAFVFLPFPLPHWGPVATYFWQWAEGQGKVFETFLFVLSFYLGFTGKPKASGVTFAFAAFDPRFGLLGLPLFLFYNKNRMGAAVKTGVVALIISNIILFYPATALGFWNMIFNRGFGTAMYAYAFIPFFTLVTLIAANAKEIVSILSKTLHRRQTSSRMLYKCNVGKITLASPLEVA